jgi:hypothetical protein
VPRSDKIGESVPFECGEEGIARLADLENAGGLDHTCIGRVETGYQVKIWFHPADDLADIDVVGSLEQTDSTVPFAHGFDNAGDAELMDHLHQVVL